MPGLAAKPIVDILVEVARLEDADLERAGYVLRVREEGHRMFRTPELDVHVHVWPSGSPDIASDLAFRDRLRASPEDRAAYEALKRELATRDWEDMNHYAEAKGALIREIRARGGYQDSTSEARDAGVAGLEVELVAEHVARACGLAPRGPAAARRRRSGGTSSRIERSQRPRSSSRCRNRPSSSSSAPARRVLVGARDGRVGEHVEGAAPERAPGGERVEQQPLERAARS